VRRTLPLGNSQKKKKKKFKPCHQEEHFIWLWLKEITRWDLRLKKRKKKRKRERREIKEKEKKRKQKKKKVKSLDEWIIQQVRKTRRYVFLTKLTMQNIEEFCFVSIVKRGHLLLHNVLPMFLINF
jgi:predicted polyphosphate/ATP-dependent NAD kinase